MFTDTITRTDIIAWNVLTDGGATWNPAAPAPATGYMVSLVGSEVQIPVAEFTREALDAYMAENAYRMHAGCFYGAWVDGDTVYLDISKNVAERAEAEIIGAANDQLAIYGIAEDAVIRL
jgi:hypothetical protein